jgi:hypothetical protein
MAIHMIDVPVANRLLNTADCDRKNDVSAVTVNAAAICIYVLLKSDATADWLMTRVAE